MNATTLICVRCGEPIHDWAAIQSRYPHPPKYCEKCRHELRGYRARTIDEHEELGTWLVGRVDFKYMPGEKRCRSKDGREYVIRYVGGRMYGRGWGMWGGAAHSGKYLVYDYVTPLEHDGAVVVRKMLKRRYEKGDDGELKPVGSWTYVVLEPYVQEDTEGLEDVVLKVHFDRVFKTTLKGFGRQFDSRIPVEGELLESLLRGGSTARSGRFGNSWRLIIVREETKEEVCENE